MAAAPQRLRRLRVLTSEPSLGDADASGRAAAGAESHGRQRRAAVAPSSDEEGGGGRRPAAQRRAAVAPSSGEEGHGGARPAALSLRAPCLPRPLTSAEARRRQLSEGALLGGSEAVAVEPPVCGSEGPGTEGEPRRRRVARRRGALAESSSESSDHVLASQQRRRTQRVRKAPLRARAAAKEQSDSSLDTGSGHGGVPPGVLRLTRRRASAYKGSSIADEEVTLRSSNVSQHATPSSASGSYGLEQATQLGGTSTAFADSGAETSGSDSDGLRRSMRSSEITGRRLASEIGTDNDPEVDDWKRDLESRYTANDGLDQRDAFSQAACGAAELRQLSPICFLGGWPIFDAEGKVNLNLLLGAFKQLRALPESCREAAARHIGWLARKACSMDLVSARELARGRVNSRRTGKARARPAPEERQPALAAERELCFPVRSLPQKRKAVATDEDAVFDDAEEDAQRFMRRKQAVMDLRSLNTSRQAQIASLSSRNVNLQKVRDTLMGPSLSFDWNGRPEDSDEDFGGITLEVDVPTNHIHRDSRRDLFKDQIQQSVSRLLAKELVPDGTGITEVAPAACEEEDPAACEDEHVPFGAGVPIGHTSDQGEASALGCSPGSEEEQLVAPVRRCRRIVEEDPAEGGASENVDAACLCGIPAVGPGAVVAPDALVASEGAREIKAPLPCGVPVAAASSGAQGAALPRARSSSPRGTPERPMQERGTKKPPKKKQMLLSDVFLRATAGATSLDKRSASDRCDCDSGSGLLKHVGVAPSLPQRIDNSAASAGDKSLGVCSTSIEMDGDEGKSQLARLRRVSLSLAVVDAENYNADKVSSSTTAPGSDADESGNEDASFSDGRSSSDAEACDDEKGECNSDCSWLADEQKDTGKDLAQVDQLRRAYLRRKRNQARRHERRLWFEVEDAQELGDATARDLLLGTATMTREEKLRWKDMIPSEGTSLAAAAWAKAGSKGAPACSTGQLLGPRGDDESRDLYGFAGTRKRISVLAA